MLGHFEQELGLCNGCAMYGMYDMYSLSVVCDICMHVCVCDVYLVCSVCSQSIVARCMWYRVCTGMLYVHSVYGIFT